MVLMLTAHSPSAACVCVCVCVCACTVLMLTAHSPSAVCVCVCVCACMVLMLTAHSPSAACVCVCVCVCARTLGRPAMSLSCRRQPDMMDTNKYLTNLSRRMRKHVSNDREQREWEPCGDSCQHPWREQTLWLRSKDFQKMTREGGMLGRVLQAEGTACAGP